MRIFRQKMKGQNLSTSKTKIEPEKREHTHKTLWMEQILEQDWQQVCHLMPSMMNTSHVALVVLVHLSSVRRMCCYRVNLLSDLCARHDLRSCDPWRFSNPFVRVIASWIIVACHPIRAKQYGIKLIKLQYITIGFLGCSFFHYLSPIFPYLN